MWPIGANAASAGIGQTKRLYADYFSDRQRRFYFRGLSRQGIWLGDPLLIFADVDGECDEDDYC
jgi:hypothetical protein